jgi:hypothetical protein
MTSRRVGDAPFDLSLRNSPPPLPSSSPFSFDVCTASQASAQGSAPGKKDGMTDEFGRAGNSPFKPFKTQFMLAFLPDPP